MNKCRRLREYAQFIACVREYLVEGMKAEEAIDIAVNKCIEQGILEELLRKHREEVCSVLLTEYDEQAHMESEREIWREEGREEGEQHMAQLIQLLIDAGRDADVKQVLVNEEYRKQLYREFSIASEKR